MAKKRSRKRERRNPAAELTDDLIVEILSRLPSRPLCRAKCVSKRWRDLISISDPHHRKRLPQTLAGVFYITKDEWRFPKEARHFASLRPGRAPLVHPSLSFLPGCERFKLVDCCNGLLLGRYFFDSDLPEMFGYVVCNPATKTWLELPDTIFGCGHGKPRTAYLAFDPAVSSHFHVFEFVEFEDAYLAGSEIYSSETEVWTFKRSYTTSEISISGEDIRSVFVNGTLHIVTCECSVLAVDTEGETWRIIPVPNQEGEEWQPGFIGRSQGHLYYMSAFHSVSDPLNLSIWVLDDYSTGEWILKHRVSKELLLEKRSVPHGTKYPFGHYYRIISIHPDCSLIFYVAGVDKTLMKYDIDRKVVHVIRNLGSDCWTTFFPFAPLYLDTYGGHPTHSD